MDAIVLAGHLLGMGLECIMMLIIVFILPRVLHGGVTTRSGMGYRRLMVVYHIKQYDLRPVRLTTVLLTIRLGHL
jgi:hypothetical protein